jgi:serine phosphatase RsbU (regulator of sigma subunit)
MAQTLSSQAMTRLASAKNAEPPRRSKLNPSPVVEFFTSLTQDLRDQITTEHLYKRGDVICQEGEAGDAMYLIWSGLAAIVKGDLDAPTLLDYRSSGDLIGEMALLEDQPRSATIVAMDDLYVLRVGRDSFRQLLTTHPPLAFEILAMLSARLRAATQDRFTQTQVEEEMTRELETAGRVQARFLPETIPALAGWEIEVALHSVWQTSGDYYDFITLPNGNLGILVADVSDKGAGAALYMALTRTLIRTYAMQYPDQPGLALQMANERILIDTTSDQFVTMFYGVLDATAGTMTYANAGHNPPLLFQGSQHEELDKTGIPLGLFVGRQWNQRTVSLDPGDALVVYTDGVSEAQDSAGGEYGTKRLLDITRLCRESSACDLHAALMKSIRDFVGDAPPFDDMTLLVVKRL